MAKGRFFVTGVKYGMRYGPHAKLLFDQVKEPAADYARARLESQRAKRLALTKARTLQDGSVLGVVHGQVPVWVVFSGDGPVSAHPDRGVPLADLLDRADLTRRLRPQEVPTPRDRAVAARERAVGTVRRRKG